LNPRPLGYEPYDIGLSRLKPSLAGAVASADRTNPISPCRLRLPFSPCLAASGLQIGLQNRRLICGLLHPPAILRATACPGTAIRSRLAKHSLMPNVVLP